MDAPQASRTHDRPQPCLPEADFSRMVAGALQAHKIEEHIDRVLQKVSPGNGSAIIGPDGIKPVRLNVPETQDLSLMCLQALRTVLQTQRITLVALNDMDSRLRLQDLAGKTNSGGDTQGQQDHKEPLAQGGSQSPAAAVTDATAQGCNQHGSSDTRTAGNP